jgi:hypothetical protein
MSKATKHETSQHAAEVIEQAVAVSHLNLPFFSTPKMENERTFHIRFTLPAELEK